MTILALTLVLSFIALFSNSYVIYKLWNWFLAIKTFNINIIEAAAISLIYAILSYRYIERDVDEVIKAIINSILSTWLYFLIGLIVKEIYL